MSLKNRSFLKLLDYTPAEIEELLDLAADLKAKKKAGIRHNDQLAGKNIALIFEKTSTRTRCSFEVAAHDLGMEVTYLDPSGSQIGKKESIADTARVLGRMFDGIEYRGYGQQIVEDLAHYAGVPVWNGLTNEFHPTQILADFLTIREHFGHLKGINFVYFGDARYNMGNSLMVGCAKMGLNFTACAPKKYQPDAALVAECQKIAAETGATLTFEEDPAKAAKGADVLAPISLCVLGPLGSIIGDGLVNVLLAIEKVCPWALPTVIGAFMPFLVMTGMHYSLLPAYVNSLSMLGYETVIGPGNLPSNIAQGAAALCVAIKTKNKNFRQLAVSGGVTALLGVTEPALFGVNVRLRKPLIATTIGGGLGGLYAGLTGVRRFGGGGAGLAAIGLYVGENPMNVINALISAAIAFVATFAILWFIGFDDVPEEA